MTWQEIVSKCTRIWSNNFFFNLTVSNCGLNIVAFLGHFGGLLGLCFGFSLINVVEIIYFATLRLYQHLSNNPKHRHQYDIVSKEDKKTRNMYTNDFQVHKRNIFQKNVS